MEKRRTFRHIPLAAGLLFAWLPIGTAQFINHNAANQTATILGGDGKTAFSNSQYPGELYINDTIFDITSTNTNPAYALQIFMQAGIAQTAFPGSLTNNGPVAFSSTISTQISPQNPVFLAGVQVGAKGGAGLEGTQSSPNAGNGGGTSNQLTLTNNDGILANFEEENGGAFSGIAAAVSATQTGGAGGTGAFVDTADANGGDGGAGGSAASVSVLNKSAIVAYSGGVFLQGQAEYYAIYAVSAGGQGGDGGKSEPPLSSFGTSGRGGVGGNSAEVEVLFDAKGSVVTKNATGVLAASIGANAGATASNNGFFTTTQPGVAAGNGADVSVTFESGASIMTEGNFAVGIMARSEGGLGGAGGSDSSLGQDGKNGGSGGNSGLATMVLENGSSVATTGSSASAIVAASLSGGGGAGGSANNIGGGKSGQGGAGGNAGVVGTNGQLLAVNVQSNAALTTTGIGSYGILAQAMSGVGGAGGSASGVFYAQGSNSSASGVVGEVVVVHGGIIQTGPAASSLAPPPEEASPSPSPTPRPSPTPGPGESSHGILAQSVAGGGGAAGAATDGLVALGGSGTTNPSLADGGNVAVTHSGTITTGGTEANGILAQSIGGGGGDGGASSGDLVAIGGSGGVGGNGGAVDFVSNGGSITTTQSGADGIVLQSVGGGGGSGGSSYVATASELPSIAIGGNSSSGGNGGVVSGALTNSTLSLSQANAAGFVAQSIGGGGGIGGAANALNAGFFVSAAAAVGGKGGDGGDGSSVDLLISSSKVSTGLAALNPATPLTAPLPTDAFGIVAQSIGGGGGRGGSSSAQTIAIAPPTPAVEPALSITYSSGGSGGSGGNGGAVNVTLSDGTEILTAGQGSIGVVAQSIAGGGGLGGDSSASSSLFTTGRTGFSEASPFKMTITLTLGVSVPGSGGPGGNAGDTLVQIGTDKSKPVRILTYGDYSHGVLAQSIAGGGGHGGFGSASTRAQGETFDLNFQIQLGAKGGTGGAAGTSQVFLNKHSAILTGGSGSNGIVVQSIGGGGGSSTGGSFNMGVSLNKEPIALTDGGTINIGSVGAPAANGGSAYASVDGLIRTLGNDSVGVMVQSIGGGGGHGGSAGSDASADNPVVNLLNGLRQGTSDAVNFTAPLDFSLTISLGGAGGSGGNGGSASADVSGKIFTSGDWSKGVLLQSIGGGGGKGGKAVANGVNGSSDASFDLGFGAASGGAGGGGGSGGQVSLTLNGAVIRTGAPAATGFNGYAAKGVVLQSIGGGGGHGGDGSGASFGILAVGGGKNTSNNGIGNGGNVSVAIGARASQIVTSGDSAHGMVLQSIGGGGGIAGAGSSVVYNSPLKNPIVSYGTVSLLLGGAAGGTGGSVQLSGTAPLTISTSGDHATGILAQSIGGGGGLAFALDRASGIGSGSGSNAGGTASSSLNTSAGTVNLQLPENTLITTTGTGAHGIVAQSIGGGGGYAGFSDSVDTFAQMPATSSDAPPTGGNGGAVSLQVNGVINTSGQAAHGIIAQSIAGGGGIVEVENNLYLGSSASSKSAVTAGNINIVQNGMILATGPDSVGILVQSDGPNTGEGNAFGGQTNVTINGTVQGGAGSGAGIVFFNGGGNKLIISQTGFLTAASGNAINVQGFPVISVQNSGVIEGSILVNGNMVSNNGLIRSADVIDGSVVNSGVLAPGASPGTTRITGDFTQTRNGMLEIELGADGQWDRLDVSGTATLGGRLVLVPLPGARWNYGDQLPFLSAGSLVGTWDEFPAIFGVRARFFVRDGAGWVAFAPDTYTRFAQNDNQLQIATALDSLIPFTKGDQNSVATELDLLAPEEYGAAFEQISPGIHGTLGNIALTQSIFQTQMLSQRLTSVRAGTKGFEVVGLEVLPMKGQSGFDQKEALDEAPLNSNWSAWVQANGIFAKTAGISQVPNSRSDSGGVFLGGSYSWNENFSTGIYAGYQGSYTRFADGSSADMHTAAFGGYATFQQGGFYSSVIVGGAYNGYKARRSIEFGELNRTARSQPNGGQFLTYLESGYDIRAGGFVFGPSIGAQYTLTGLDAFAESGADSLDLNLGGQSINSLRTFVGGRAAFEWQMTSKVWLVPEIRMFWQHEFLNDSRTLNASINGTAFSQTTSAPGRDSVFGGAGVTIQWGERWSGNLFYNADFAGQNFLGQSVSGGVLFRF